MSYPYLTDFINTAFGTNWNIPMPTFGAFVALAILVAAAVAKKEVMRFEKLGILPMARVASNNVPVHSLIADLAMISALFGILGARIFHILEYPHMFLENPWGMIFSRDGLSIYGGLIFGVVSGTIYLRKRAVPILPMLDAMAPSIALGYGIGRIGCQVSGDGDWGAAANMALKPDWLSDWFWAQTYDNNIAGVLIPSPGVYPTPIYESLMAFTLFLVLWLLRKNSYRMGYIFSIYLLLSGFSRLLIEKIRINSEYHLLGMDFTQAELISVALILGGLFGVLKSTKSKAAQKVMFSLIVLSAVTACSVF
jgi:phosphatidylglycerol:prolipoprotein diacylglycerol transferase